MSRDPFDVLASIDVPRPPADFDRRLHQRLNRALLAQHGLDFVLRAMPQALIELARAAAGCAVYTLTGRYAPQKNDPKDR